MTAFEKARDFFMKKEVEYCEKAEEEDIPLYPLQLDETINLAISEGKIDLWNTIKIMQMSKGDKPFLDGYLCLSEKQCNDIEKFLRPIPVKAVSADTNNSNNEAEKP